MTRGPILAIGPLAVCRDRLLLEVADVTGARVDEGLVHLVHHVNDEIAGYWNDHADAYDNEPDQRAGAKTAELAGQVTGGRLPSASRRTRLQDQGRSLSLSSG